MKTPKSILYAAPPFEGERSHAAVRAERAESLRAMLAHAPARGEWRAVSARLTTEELSASAPERAEAFSLALAKGRIGEGLFYADASDCLGDGELLLRSLLLSSATPREYPALLTSSAPQTLPQLLCHFGHTQVCLAGEKSRIKAPVCCENQENSYIWRSPDGSECRLLLPENDIPVTPDLRRADFGTPKEGGIYTGRVRLARPDAWEACAAENRRAADLLLGELEPLSVLFASVGRSVCSQATLRRLTAALLKNLSVTDTRRLSPTVYAHRLDRLCMLTEEAEGYIQAAMQDALPRLPQGEEIAALVVFSPYGEKSDAAFTASLTLRKNRPFRLLDAEGRELHYDVLETHTASDGQTTHRLRLLHPALPPLSLSRISVVWGDPCVAKKAKSPAKPCIENAYFRCDGSGGRLKITCKRTGRVLQNPFFFEDQGDRGTEEFCPAQEGSLLFFPEEWNLTEQGIVSVLESVCRLEIPADYDAANWERTAATRTVLCHLTLKLTEGSDTLQVHASLEDTAARHRLRLAVRTDMPDGLLTADIPFGFEPVTEKRFFPASSLCMAGERDALALLQDTRRETERVNDTLYITLSHRAPYLTDTDPACEMSLGLVTAQHLSFSHIFTAARRFRLSPRTASVCFTNAPPVGEGYPAARFGRPFLSFESPTAVFTGAKCRTDGSGTVVHLYNPSGKETAVRLFAERPLSLCSLSERETVPLAEGGSVAIRLAPHQIVALLLQN